jgi:hypothetical protein
MASNMKTFASFAHFWGLTPAIEYGPKAMPISLDPAATTHWDIDLWQEATEHQMPFVQSAWIDNAFNPNPILIRTGVIGQRIMVPAFSQATRPVLVGNPPQFTIDIKEAFDNGSIEIIFLDVPLPIFTSVVA